MKFIDSLTERINSDLELPVRMIKSYLGTGESLVVYPLPGGKSIRKYMDRSEDISLNYEIAMKSKDPEMLGNVLWEISDYIEGIQDLNSDGFYFGDIAITNKPYITDADEKGWFVFVLDFEAKITIDGGN